MSHPNEGEHLNLEAGKLVKRNQKWCSSKLFWETMHCGGFKSKIKSHNPC